MIRYKSSKYDDPFVVSKIDSLEIFEDGFKTSMQTLIEYFNSEYKWDEMFSIEDVVKRLNDGNTLFILWSKESPLGYVFFKEIDSDTTFLYNFYVTKVLDRSKTLPIKFINIVCREMFQKYNEIELECEEWNIAAQKVFEINDFKKIND